MCYQHYILSKAKIRTTKITLKIDKSKQTYTFQIHVGTNKKIYNLNLEKKHFRPRFYHRYLQYVGILWPLSVVGIRQGRKI